MVMSPQMIRGLINLLVKGMTIEWLHLFNRKEITGTTNRLNHFVLLLVVLVLLMLHRLAVKMPVVSSTVSLYNLSVMLMYGLRAVQVGICCMRYRQRNALQYVCSTLPACENKFYHIYYTQILRFFFCFVNPPAVALRLLLFPSQHHHTFIQCNCGNAPLSFPFALALSILSSALNCCKCQPQWYTKRCGHTQNANMYMHSLTCTAHSRRNA